MSSPFSRTRPGGISSLLQVEELDDAAGIGEGDVRPASAPGATARYIAPVSRNSNPSRLASPRAAVLLPEPAGPSIVTIM